MGSGIAIQHGRHLPDNVPGSQGMAFRVCVCMVAKSEVLFRWCHSVKIKSAFGNDAEFTRNCKESVVSPHIPSTEFQLPLMSTPDVCPTASPTLDITKLARMKRMSSFFMTMGWRTDEASWWMSLVWVCSGFVCPLLNLGLGQVSFCHVIPSHLAPPMLTSALRPLVKVVSAGGPKSISSCAAVPIMAAVTIIPLLFG